MPTLYVVATPIGNLGDLSPNAVETLRSVALIAAEDTRVTQKLVNVFELGTPLTSYHAHNERGRAAQLIQRMLAENIDIALTTDAGTPCISDPGSVLVQEAAQAGIKVVAVAGPSAMAAALSVSGFPVEEFTFFGFLPRTKGELKEKLLDMAMRSRLAVVHESPHRVIGLLQCVRDLLPGTQVSASCDLTKKHELTVRGVVGDVLGNLLANPKANKGEYCLVFLWAQEDIPTQQGAASALSQEARLFDGLMAGLSLRESMEKLIGEGERKNAVYAASLRVKEKLREDALQ